MSNSEQQPTPASGPGIRRQRLNRLQQLTLNVWRLSATRVSREVAPDDVLAHAAVHAVLAVLRDTNEAMGLFARHDRRAEEFALVASLVCPDRVRDSVHDLLDSSFLLRWLELTSDGDAPEELPPLTRPCGSQPLLP